MTIPTISIIQPWAWLIVNGYKPVENRTWKTNVRGLIAIAASKTEFYEEDIEEIESKFKLKLPRDYEVGRIVGFANLVDCVTSHSSPFFFGPFGFVLSDAVSFDGPFVRGIPGFYPTRFPDGFSVPTEQTRFTPVSEAISG